MKHKWLIPIALIAVLLFIAVVAYAQGGLTLPWWTVDSGGGSIQGDTFKITGSMGQSSVGTSQGGNFRLSGGFLASGEGETQYQIFLPIIVK
jgi:hypothetical protein